MNRKTLSIASIAIFLSSLKCCALSVAFHQIEGATNRFNAGAGIGVDGAIFDNRLMQTFIASETGFLSSISFVVSSFSSTADLRVSLVSVNFDPFTQSSQPISTLDTTTIGLSEIYSGSLPLDYDFTNQAMFGESTQLFAGERYGFLLSTDTTNANYRFYGSRSPGVSGKLSRFQNTGLYSPLTGDLFFNVEVNPIPEPSSFAGILGLVAAVYIMNTRPQRGPNLASI